MASDVLWGLGVRAIEERSTTLTNRGVADDGLVELWTAVGEDDASIQRGIGAIGGRWHCRVEEVNSASADTWRDYARPIRIDDDVVIVPAWQHPGGADHRERHDVTSPPLSVYIEPGGAFGLGDHPTTRASLRAVVRLVAQAADHSGPQRGGNDGRDNAVGVLDVGCGTGVIAIVAALLQPGPVRAIDVAAAAVEATAANARRNGVDDQILVDASPLGAIDGTYEVVVANILAPTLIALADDLRRVTRV